jgi:hypothetical protein
MKERAADPSARPDAPPREASALAPVRCTSDGLFPTTWHVAEASSAAEVSLLPKARELLVISDSGNAGEAMLWGIPHGPLRSIRLPLDPAASDDIEGAAWLAGQLFTLTSSGAVQVFLPDGTGGLTRVGNAYGLGPPPFACPSLKDINCGKNYEGLCLRAKPSSARCAGYAASKRDETLDCLVLEGGKLRVDPIKPPIVLDLPRQSLSDCAFGAADGPARDVLLVTTNVYNGSTSYEVDEATGTLAPLDVVGLPNNEAIAVDSTGALYELMDSDSKASLAYRLVCEGWAVGPRDAAQSK